MTSLLVQNLINQRQQSYNTPVTDFGRSNSNKIEFKPRWIKPAPPKGHLVTNKSTLEVVNHKIKSLFDSGKYFLDAINGKGSDYTVGKINDGTKLAGSFGIASILASTAKTPKAKAMEFVGFATWFSSMALWPGFINNRINASKGVDLGQEYIDSQGRQKLFYQDAQYIPWNLKNQSELHQMGDKLGIPTNIKNRNEAIQHKATQIAIQGNTLAMLTAGFATPVVTALLCNKLETPVEMYLDTVKVKKAEKSLSALETNSLMANFKQIEKLEKIIGTDKTTTMNNKLIQLFKNSFETTGTYQGIKDELKALTTKTITFDKTTKKEILNSLNTAIKDKKVDVKIDNKTFEKIIGEKFAKTASLSQTEAQVLNTKIAAELTPILRTAGVNSTARKEIKTQIIQNTTNLIKRNTLLSLPTAKVKQLFEVAQDFATRRQYVDNFNKATIGNVADSQTAMRWGKNPQKILNALGFNKATQKSIIANPLQSTKIIDRHMENLAKPSNEKAFKKAVEKIIKISKEIIQTESKASKTLNNSWNLIESKSLAHAKYSGFDSLCSAIQNTAKSETTNIANKLGDTKSSYFKPLMVLDAYKSNTLSKEAKSIRLAHMGIDNFFNKFERFGNIRSKLEFSQFKNLMDEVFSPVKEISKIAITHEDTSFINKMNSSMQKLKQNLSGLVNETKQGLNTEGTLALNDLSKRVGKNFDDLIKDASKQNQITNTWFKRVSMIGVPLVAVTLWAINQFGEKNKYNPDIYQVKGSN